jgi:LPXTG-motif cell wall-anchored protein
MLSIAGMLSAGAVVAGATAASADPSPEKKIAFCHATGAGTYTFNDTSVNAFYKDGHISHADDIFPAGSAKDGGREVSWPAQGDQSLLTTGCVAPKPIQVAVPATPQVTDPCGRGNAVWVVPADGGNVTWELKAGGNLVATPDKGYTFPGGKTSHDFGQAPETNVADCVVEIALPATPQVTDPCGRGNAVWVVPADGGNVTWDLKAGGNLVATADTGYTFPGGKTSHDFGQAPETNVTACPLVLASVGVAAPVLTGPTCTAPGVPTYEDATGYTWSRTERNGDVTLTAIARSGFTLTGTTSWTFTAAQLAQLSDAQVCPPGPTPVVTPPAVIPPKVEGVKHTAPPTRPTVTPVVRGVKHEVAATLPRTGSESGLYAGAGVLLLMAGSGMVLVTRRSSVKG